MTNLETYPEHVQLSEGARQEAADRLFLQNHKLMVEHDTMHPVAVTYPQGAALEKKVARSFPAACL